MKLFTTLSIAAIMILAYSSCEKVIDIKLRDADQKYVIEGNITNEPGQCSVSITQTKAFSEDNNFPGVSGATVTVSDNGGTAIPLVETGQGIYTTSIINGAPGHTYTLKILVNGKTFGSVSTLPLPVNLDSIFIEDRILFGDSTKIVNITYKDPAAVGDAYRFLQYRNNVQEKTVFVNNDDFTNGNAVTTQLLVFGNDDDDKKIKAGDSIKVTMQCLDTPVYKYWFSIDAATGESNNATPANPVTNITGGALGYFSAHTTQSKTVRVP
ncbi:MAG: DUF4249 domain-containing protein [Chitinophagaceae bacterium]